ncbi:uncharacterized protein LOC107269535 [Cephus cinctus]|uniref:Uncharacterized protein LOC107269535 n=1 Tax=Cephus cinctus TaxID=211228 RepID=A0AAJ7C0I4_CEPCN|nr:uncharacterized protein LOC107269535 [Cephus cinctus]
MKRRYSAKLYPGTTCRKVLLCLAILYSLLVNSQQQDARESWKKLSSLLPANSVYDKQESIENVDEQPLKDASGSPGENENNVMGEKASQEDEEIYSDEYELEPHVDEAEEFENSQPEKATKPTEKKLSTDAVESDGNSSQEPQDYTATNQYDSYYYYEDYDNNTHPHYATVDNGEYESNENSETTIEIKETITEPTLPEKASSMQGSDRHYVVAEVPRDPQDSLNLDKSFLIGEAVVSVVTTKSVVNGTISVPVTALPMTTQQILAPPTNFKISSSPETENEDADGMRFSTSALIDTTENSRIVASVQTSRSISGARFLPFPVVEQVEQVAPGSGSKKTSGSVESTESIIDKLDRVQSELSSGFLTGGFRTAGNTLQLDVLNERDQSRRRYTTTGRTPVISKFVPFRYNSNRKTTTPRSRVPEKTVDSLDGLLPPDFPTNRALSAIGRSAVKGSSFNSTLNNQGKNNPRPSAKPKSTVVQDLTGLLPPGYKLKKEDTATTEKNLLAEILSKSQKNISSNRSSSVQDVSAFLPPGYRLRNTESTTEKNILSDILAKTKKENANRPPATPDLSALLPPGYKLKKEDSSVTEKSLLSDILAKSKVDISALLPPGYEKKVNDSKITEKPNNSPTEKSPGKSIQDLFAKSDSDISALLPPGYKEKFGNNNQAKSNSSPPIATESPVVSTTKAGGLKIVFPSRPGGRKPIQRITTPHPVRGEAPGAFTPKIQKGWPTRATTEFTGWPSSSTTPISIEKLLEVAKTATVGTIGASSSLAPSAAPTTSTTTTTTTTPRPTTPGTCEEECELAGTIRIVGNTTWVPELLDRNTHEWQELADHVEREMNIVFSKSDLLRKWYRKIRIDSFSQGSILVDYFVELADLHEKINTQELKRIFHDSLTTDNINQADDERVKTQLKLGSFAIDPKFTDFIVLPKVNAPLYTENNDTLIPQWAIAVIVIGVGGLLFIIVFGVSVLINRQNVTKLKPTISTVYEDSVAKNMIHGNHNAPIQRSSDYSKSETTTIWNDVDSSWNEKSYESTSNKILMDGPIHDDKRYNVYDSWRSEWNGYYYNPSQSSSSKFAGYDSTTNLSRHHPDYDTNF